MSFFLDIVKPTAFNALTWFQFLLFTVLLLTGQINAVNFVMIYFLESIVIGFFSFLFSTFYEKPTYRFGWR
jgi:hypothetical protein